MRESLETLRAALGDRYRIEPERFLREICITAGLTHAHILPLHDSREVGALLYYVMPYVEGETLRARLNRERQLPIDEPVAVALDVASALSCAHSYGMLHRDIKPENILLSGGQALVADFGIAHSMSEGGDAGGLPRGRL